MKDKQKGTENNKPKVKDQKQKVINPEIELLKDQLARALADYENLRRRTDEEKKQWIKFATQKFINNLLPVLDIFEASLKHTNDQGLAIGINQLKDLLREEGLEEVKPKEGETFDENLHEAIDTKEGKAAELILPGWRFVDGNMVRHAKVRVFKEAQKAS
jgi:molecular chaperone GrpE